MLMPIASSTEEDTQRRRRQRRDERGAGDVAEDAADDRPLHAVEVDPHVVADHDGQGERGADEDDGPGQLRCNERGEEGNGHETQAEPHSACTTAPTATEVRTTMMTPAVTPSRAADGARRVRGAPIPALEGGQVVGRQVPERRQRDLE